MAVIGTDYLDLIEIFKGKDGKGDVAHIINMMSQTNAILEDAVVQECNDGSTHLSNFIASIPTPEWGKLYKGLANGRISRGQVRDATGFVELMSTVDCRLEKYTKNLAAYRLQEAQGIVEGIAQEGARSIFYEDQSVNPDRITGLAPRFNSLSSPQGSQIIDAQGSSSDNTSIWFVQWGADAVSLIYPEGSDAGISRTDHGKQRVTDADGKAYYAYEEDYRWDLGLAVRDYRKIVRIANIDVSDLRAGSVDIYKYMRKALYQWHGARRADQGMNGMGDVGDGNFKMGRGTIYCNKDVFEALDAEGSNNGSSDNFVRLKPMEIQGKEVDTYRGFPIRQVDQIINTEAQVT